MTTINETIESLKMIKTETDNVYVISAINKAIEEIKYGPASRI